MKIILDSPINKYYVQTLGMIFFPGEHFAENEELAAGEPILSVKTVEEEKTSALPFIIGGAALIAVVILVIIVIIRKKRK